MKIVYVKGNLLTTDIKHILHGCNCQGVMGSGVAKAIRAKYPKAYEDYKDTYIGSGLELGTMIFSAQADGKVIINAMSQDRYGKTGGPFVSYEALTKIFDDLNDFDLGEVAMPMIGAGLGGGEWKAIESIINSHAKNYTPVVYQL
jgi:O-acetyl-ADP-ribose deacetylase (regulator of RNase III)